MSAREPLRGVVVPVITPFKADFAPDGARFVRLCRRLLVGGARALAPFGTTSEANSLGVSQRAGLLDTLLAAGIAPGRLLPGTGTCALADTIHLTRQAVTAGCAGVLLLPPFYYKNLDDDGLFGYFARVIEGVGDPKLKVYLYHIPGLAGVGYSIPLIARLVEAYPRTVVGLKDSSGDFAHTQGLTERFPRLGIFVGSEAFLLDHLRGGGAGCISATANIQLTAISAVYAAWCAGILEAEVLQYRATQFRQLVQEYPLIAAVKAIVAHQLGDPAFALPCPPLQALDPSRTDELLQRLAQAQGEDDPFTDLFWEDEEMVGAG